MDNTIKKIAKIASVVIMAIAAIYGALLIFNGGAYKSATPEALSGSVLDSALIITYVIFAIAVISALIFPIIRMVSSPKNAIKGLLGMVVIFVVCWVSYLLSSNEFTPQQLEKLQTTESASIWTGAGLILTYIVGSLSILSTIFLVIRGSISK